MEVPIDLKLLRSVCLAKEQKYIPTGSNYYFQDNGSQVLAVAHMDYVCRGVPDYVSYKYKGRYYAQSETLDDRLGAYLILHVLPAMGIKVDVLLTTDEEIGKSTANDFITTKKYNWIFSFDRRGNDIVAYDYEDDDLLDKIKKVTTTVISVGSFSDICSLEHLGVKGLNFGTGYYNEHTEYCWCCISDVERAVRTFKKFYDAYKNVYLPHTPRYKTYAGGTRYSRVKGGTTNYSGRFGMYDDEYYDGEVYISAEGNVEGVCFGCKKWSKLTWDNVLCEYFCDDCAGKEYEEEVKDIAEEEEFGEYLPDEHCKMCSMDGTESKMYKIFIPGTTPPEPRLVCEYCYDYLMELMETEPFSITEELFIF